MGSVEFGVTAEDLKAMLGKSRGEPKTPLQGISCWLRKARTTVALWLVPDIQAAAPPRPAPSPYKDSTQFGVTAEGTFAPFAWGEDGTCGTLAKDGEDSRTIILASGSALTTQLKAEFEQGWDLIAVVPPTSTCLPMISGNRRVYQSTKPEKLILSESITATYTNAEQGSKSISVVVEDASDLVLVSAFCGSYNCFPNAPSQDGGISGQAFSVRSLGSGIHWPTIHAGIDLAVSLAVEKTALYRVPPPDGYADKDLASVHVMARLSVFGQGLR